MLNTLAKAAGDSMVGASPQTPGEHGIELRRLTKRFDSTVALDDASLAVRRGEFMTLLGPSGCGKTTILNLVAGFINCDEGQISIDGELVNSIPTHQRGIGIVFQNYALFPHMNVDSNVAYGLRARGVSSSETARRVKEALDLVQLSGFESRKPRQLSGGQQQRVALARALVLQPKVLLLDEPFSALDKSLRASMQIEIREIQSKLGVTTIFVTHDQGEALSMSDRIAVMSAGKIRQVGTPRDVYESPADRFVASFVGDVSMFRGTGSGDRDVTIGQTTVKLDKQVPSFAGSALHLFARPEHLTIVEPSESGALRGVVQTIVYQGSHIDVYLACNEAVKGQSMVRVPATIFSGQIATGSTVGIRLIPEKLNVFEASD